MINIIGTYKSEGKEAPEARGCDRGTGGQGGQGTLGTQESQETVLKSLKSLNTETIREGFFTLSLLSGKLC